jgi:hypothetical protein
MLRPIDIVLLAEEGCQELGSLAAVGTRPTVIASALPIVATDPIDAASLQHGTHLLLGIAV